MDRGRGDNHLIHKFTSEGVFVSDWSINIAGGWPPAGIAVAPDGSVYVADESNHSIQKFTSEGVFVRKWGTFGTGDGNFHEPRGITVGSDDTVYIADYGNNRIKKFTIDQP